eukprot:g10958.t1
MERKQRFFGLFACNCGLEHDLDDPLLECPEIDFGDNFGNEARFDAGAKERGGGRSQNSYTGTSAGLPLDLDLDEFGFSPDPVFRSVGPLQIGRSRRREEAAYSPDVKAAGESGDNFDRSGDNFERQSDLLPQKLQLRSEHAIRIRPPTFGVPMLSSSGAPARPLGSEDCNQVEDQVEDCHLSSRDSSPHVGPVHGGDGPMPNKGADVYSDHSVNDERLSDDEVTGSPKPDPVHGRDRDELLGQVADALPPFRTGSSPPHSVDPAGPAAGPTVGGEQQTGEQLQYYPGSPITSIVEQQEQALNSGLTGITPYRRSGTNAVSRRQSIPVGRTQPISGKVFIRRKNYFHQDDNSFNRGYLENCNTYHIKIDPGVVSCLQTEGQDLYISCDGLLAVASILCNPKNPCVTRLHVQARYETRSNQYVCLILEQILHANRTLLRVEKIQEMLDLFDVQVQVEACRVLDLFDVGINCDGMNYLKNGLQYHPSVRQLLLARNDLGPKGAKVLIRVCVTMPLLEKVDVRFCEVGATYSYVLHQLSAKHPKNPEIFTEGNTDTEEIWGAITHGLGLLWALVSSIYMTVRVRHNPSHQVLGCLIYSCCLVLLFLFSTLFHSFYLKILDHCGIFLFIAASYTPVVMLSELSKGDAIFMMVAQWCLALFGMVAFIIAFYFETFKQYYSLIEPFVCLMMGWMI